MSTIAAIAGLISLSYAYGAARRELDMGGSPRRALRAAAADMALTVGIIALIFIVVSFFAPWPTRDME
jgi:hypothetical protein